MQAGAEWVRTGGEMCAAAGYLPRAMLSRRPRVRMGAKRTTLDPIPARQADGRGEAAEEGGTPG